MIKISRAKWMSVALVSVIMIVVSCSKSNSTNTSAITKDNIAGSYMLTAATGSIPGLPPQNVYDSIPPCQRDDIYKLNPDYTMNYIDAGTKCVPPGDTTSTWNLNGSKLVIGVDTATIQSFNGKTLVVSSVVTIVGIAVTTTDTFTKQ
ncbi:MAG: lipocalin family protein [Chitinophagales bacterium]